MNAWFTSDLHFGHANILRYCKRPWLKPEDLNDEGEWKSPEIAKTRCSEMNIAIINNMNERIKDDDLVFHVGDFCFKNSKGGKLGEGEIYKPNYYKSKLKGKWVHIKGNHDKNNSNKTPIEKVVIKFGGKRINLVHNPIHADLSFEFNFVGHVHNVWKFKKVKDSYLCNVGVDVWKFYPVSFNQIMGEFFKWKTQLKITEND